jgi:hypothetical protein
LSPHPYRTGIDHPAERDHAHLGGAATDIHHHRPGGIGHRQAGTDGRRHRLFDQIDVARPGSQGRIADRAALHLGGAAGHADDDARAGREQARIVYLLDELLDHLLGDHEVRDHPVLHRTDGGDVAWRLAEHLLGGMTHGLNRLLGVGAAFGTNGDHRWFIQHDALAARVDQGVGRTEVDCEIVGKI